MKSALSTEQRITKWPAEDNTDSVIDSHIIASKLAYTVQISSRGFNNHTPSFY